MTDVKFKIEFYYFHKEVGHRTYTHELRIAMDSTGKEAWRAASVSERANTIEQVIRAFEQRPEDLEPGTRRSEGSHGEKDVTNVYSINEYRSFLTLGDWWSGNSGMSAEDYYSQKQGWEIVDVNSEGTEGSVRGVEGAVGTGGELTIEKSLASTAKERK